MGSCFTVKTAYRLLLCPEDVDNADFFKTFLVHFGTIKVSSSSLENIAEQVSNEGQFS